MIVNKKRCNDRQYKLKKVILPVSWIQSSLIIRWLNFFLSIICTHIHKHLHPLHIYTLNNRCPKHSINNKLIFLTTLKTFWSTSFHVIQRFFFNYDFFPIFDTNLLIQKLIKSSMFGQNISSFNRRIRIKHCLPITNIPPYKLSK